CSPRRSSTRSACTCCPRSWTRRWRDCTSRRSAAPSPGSRRTRPSTSASTLRARTSPSTTGTRDAVPEARRRRRAARHGPERGSPDGRTADRGRGARRRREEHADDRARRRAHRRLGARLVLVEGLDGAGDNTLTTARVDVLTARGLSTGNLACPRYGALHADLAADALHGGQAGTAGSPHAMALLFAFDRHAALGELEELRSTHDVVLLDRYVAS